MLLVRKQKPKYTKSSNNALFESSKIECNHKMDHDPKERCTVGQRCLIPPVKYKYILFISNLGRVVSIEYPAAKFVNAQRMELADPYF